MSCHATRPDSLFTFLRGTALSCFIFTTNLTIPAKYKAGCGILLELDVYKGWALSDSN